ncbi:DivIVA domain-containing protein [Umezawaea endophytica]|uniref:DivIVA domain-containing protein n=1 Tax=Umezawaea endophytica TaxID=1654476 RepID=A0A9X3AEU6_9PSEU|nr:DivIVA domain-containing protein [Umezawaea endophytica]MCS7477782.1 DivIVA domain-containing protein [Umezawaea endophytica]
MIDEMLKEVDRCFDVRWRGYDREQVDARFADADRELEAVYRDRDSWVKAAADLTRQLAEARQELAGSRSSRTGWPPEDAPTTGVRREAVEDDPREAVPTGDAPLDEVEWQRRLTEAAHRAREIVCAALAESRHLIEDLAERQRELDEWYADAEASIDVPAPRRPTAETTETTGRHQLTRPGTSEPVRSSGPVG